MWLCDLERNCFFPSRSFFFLHESFAYSVRTVTAAPFEVTESGWGEFGESAVLDKMSKVVNTQQKQNLMEETL